MDGEFGVKPTPQMGMKRDHGVSNSCSGAERRDPEATGKEERVTLP